MNVAHSAEFRVTGTELLETGQLKDISEGGFLLSAVRELDPGTGLAVTLHSASSKVVAAAWVLRCSSTPNGQYDIACAFD
ncbi:MAG: hypothetical protein ACI8PT_003489 [Gammaproteobacteria bacterium]|jgi:hypothetical protein